jgi:hypothetical protein
MFAPSLHPARIWYGIGFIAWRRAANIESFFIFNMGDGTLQEALK